MTKQEINDKITLWELIATHRAEFHGPNHDSTLKANSMVKSLLEAWLEIDEKEEKIHSPCFDDIKKEIEENEMIELNGILEEGSPKDIIKRNIKYILKERGVYDIAEKKGEKINISVEIIRDSKDENGTDTLMGYYKASNSYESIEGVFIADGYLVDRYFSILSLTLENK